MTGRANPKVRRATGRRKVRAIAGPGAFFAGGVLLVAAGSTTVDVTEGSSAGLANEGLHRALLQTHPVSLLGRWGGIPLAFPLFVVVPLPARCGQIRHGQTAGTGR